jgi:hypothetical protein
VLYLLVLNQNASLHAMLLQMQFRKLLTDRFTEDKREEEI